jgi:hypothetical protein
MTGTEAADELAGARPVSGLAVAALLAGCGSALVLFMSLAAMLPLVATALAVAALREVARSEGRRVGRGPALLGLALAIGFGAQAAGGFVVARWVSGRRAVATATAWIDAVREARFADAIGLCSPLALPPVAQDPARPPTTEADRAAGLQTLPAVAAVAACGRASRPAVSVRKDAADDVSWIAGLDLAPCGRPGELVMLRVEPQVAARGRQPVERWLVTWFELADE